MLAIFTMSLVGIRVLVSGPHDFNARIYALIALDTVCYVILPRQDYTYWSPPAIWTAQQPTRSSNWYRP